jgi:hypothetical protein
MVHNTAISRYLAEIGRKGGIASGKARMEKLTREQRVAVAKTAAAARWAIYAAKSPVCAPVASVRQRRTAARGRG